MIGLIGAGAFGWNHVKVGIRLGLLTQVADLSVAVRTRIEQEFPSLSVVPDIELLLKNPAVRGVIIATPAATHYSVAKAGLLAGKDVLIEKPMTLDAKQARELKELAMEKQKVLMVGHLLFYKPAYTVIKNELESGRIGRLQHVEMRRLKLGKVRREENVLWSFAPHDIAVLLGLTQSEVVKANASGYCYLQPQVEDNVRLDLQFANKTTATIHVSWFWPEDERKTFLIGDQGMLVYHENQDRLIYCDKKILPDLSAKSGTTEEVPIPAGDALENEWAHFAACIRSRETPRTDAEQGEKVVKILSEATKQLRTENKEYFAHESAYVDEPCKVGKGTQIWHFSHIMKNTEIGENCRIGQNVVVAPGVKIGNGVKIQNNVSVYEGVELEDYVFCGPSMVFTNVRTPRSEFPRNTSADYVRTLVKRGASIGANATIVCGTTIGERAFIGAGAVVTKDVPDYAVVHGNPATIKGWACACGDVFIKKNESKLICSRCGTDKECGE